MVERLISKRQGHSPPFDRPVLSGALVVIAAVVMVWTSTLNAALVAPLNAARADHTATLLPDGRVLVTGGEGPGDAFLLSG